MSQLDSSEIRSRALPDAQSEKNLSLQSTLDWVGMRQIELPIALPQEQGVFTVPARIDAMVNLVNPEAKGIHMSRLYLILQEKMATQAATAENLRQVLEEMLSTHKGLSSAARLTLSFEGIVKRKALKSDNYGWRTYPMMIEATLQGDQFRFFVTCLVSYSSTCPASAALSRRLIQEKFVSDFASSEVDQDLVLEWLGSTNGIVATPHSQRSEARVKVEVKNGEEFSPFELVNLVEASLKTAVQGAVKREDEQEFALLNGSNLMFCEDAARRVQRDLEKTNQVANFTGEFLHLESLHPHNAMARIRSKNADFGAPTL